MFRWIYHCLFHLLLIILYRSVLTVSWICIAPAYVTGFHQTRTSLLLFIITIIFPFIIIIKIIKIIIIVFVICTINIIIAIIIYFLFFAHSIPHHSGINGCFNEARSLKTFFFLRFCCEFVQLISKNYIHFVTTISIFILTRLLSLIFEKQYKISTLTCVLDSWRSEDNEFGSSKWDCNQQRRVDKINEPTQWVSILQRCCPVWFVGESVVSNAEPIRVTLNVNWCAHTTLPFDFSSKFVLNVVVTFCN